MNWCCWPCELLGFVTFVLTCFVLLVIIPTEFYTYNRLSADPEKAAEDHDLWNMKQHWNDGYRTTFFTVLSVWGGVLVLGGIIWCWCRCRRRRRDEIVVREEET